MPNVMAALPNIGGALCSTPQSLANAHYYSAVQDAKPVEISWVPQTPEPTSAVSRPKFAVLWGHVQEVLLFNKFFFRLSICASVAKI